MLDTERPARFVDDRAVEAALDEAADACARDGAQLTPLRRLVLRLVLRASHPLTAYQLLDQLKVVRAGAAPPTIYRALDFLVAHKLIHKVERLGAFMGCTEAALHDHPVQFLICARCGTVAELDDPAVTHALEDAAGRAGFHASSSVVELEGTCAACSHAG